MDELNLENEGSAVMTPPDQVRDERIDKLSRLLALVKQGSDASDAEKETAAAAAVDIIDALKTSLQYFGDSEDYKSFSKTVVLRDATDGSRALFMLTKFHRQQPPTPPTPLAIRWDIMGRNDHLPTALDELKQRAGPDLYFSDWSNLAAYTAKVFIGIGRVPQAKEVLELWERRLLKIKQRNPRFRDMVRQYQMVRGEARLTPSTGFTPEAEREFEWYVLDHGITSKWIHRMIDMMRGCGYYRRVRVAGVVDNLTHDAFVHDVIEAKVPAVYLDGSIFLGAETREDLEQSAKAVKAAAIRAGIRLRPDSTARDSTTFSIAGYTFSGDKIARE